jgi:hypothetical protein
MKEMHPLELERFANSKERIAPETPSASGPGASHQEPETTGAGRS